ncbi:cytochrome P450 [Peniophora sp. CONT]|nr:cytochrome P450 [Peniophora sp. CONT]
MMFYSAITAVLAYYLISMAWNLTFHPLSCFPGPKIAAATGWYATYYEVFKDGSLVDRLFELHKKYGPVVRFGPNRLHFNTIEAYIGIYARDSTFIKDSTFYDTMREQESSFGYIDPRAARTRRDILLPLFSRKAILDLEPVVLGKCAQVETLLSRILECGRNDAAVHMHRALRSFSLDVIIAYCFAGDARTLDTPAFEHDTVLTQEALFPQLLVLANFSWVFPVWIILAHAKALFRGLLGLTRGDANASVSGLGRAVKQIDEMLKNPEKLEQQQHDTVFHHLLTPHPEKGPYGAVPSRQSLVDEAAALIGAGGDTVASAVAFGVFHILKDNQTKAKLVAELDEMWSEFGTVGLQQLEKLPYLTAIIKESLRISHGVVYPAPRVVRPFEAVIDGNMVPAGTVVSMGSMFMHLNPDLFPEPYMFRPERWLQSDAPRLDQYLVAFSKGPRSCLGTNLAWCELYLLFGYIFRFLDIDIAPGTMPDYEHYRCHFLPTIAQDRMLRCVVHRRAD